jgi:hypothetical protein
LRDYRRGRSSARRQRGRSEMVAVQVCYTHCVAQGNSLDKNRKAAVQLLPQRRRTKRMVV